MLTKTMLLAAMLVSSAVVSPAFAQDCDEDLGCDDGGLGGGGLGGLGGGGIVPGKGGTVAPLPPAAVSNTTTINFNGLNGIIGQPITSYTEGGYAFTVASGTIYRGYGQGSSAGLYVLGPGAAAYVPGPANILSLVRTDGGLFSVDSLFNINASTDGINSLVLTGYLNNMAVTSSTVTTQGVYGFGFPQLSGLTGAFDRVSFNFSTTGSSNAFDNLTVTSVAATGAVPEPATWAMMIAGFGLVGYAMRRRAKPVVTFA